MNTTTAAQRHNKRQDKIWDECMKAKAAQPQAQHPPLPWHCDSERVWNDAGEIVAKMVASGSATRKANVKLIVASVNHAEALAEALREFVRVMEHPKTTASMPHTVAKARKALANWEAAQS